MATTSVNKETLVSLGLAAAAVSVIVTLVLAVFTRLMLGELEPRFIGMETAFHALSEDQADTDAEAVKLLKLELWIERYRALNPQQQVPDFPK